MCTLCRSGSAVHMASLAYKKQSLHWRDCTSSFKWPFMQRWQFPIHNGTLETFILSKNVILGLNVDSEMGTLVEKQQLKEINFQN